MTPLEREFDAYFKSTGGKCRDQFSNPPMVQNLLMYARAEVEFLRTMEKNIPPIYVDLVDNPALNAAAGKNGDCYFIGIYIGALIQPFVVFSRMLASNTILKDIGNPALEGPPRKIHDIQLKDVMHPISSFARDISPKDPVRSATITMFLKHLVDFLVLHEYAHIVYGHLDFCNSTSRFPTSVDPFILQTLEAHADSFSTITNLSFLFTADPKESPMITDELRSYYQDRDMALKLWLFPLYTYFRLFGHTNLRHSMTADKHPAPGCRSNMLMENMHSFMDDTFSDLDVDKLVEHNLDIIMEVEEAFAQISEQGLDTRALESSFSEEMVNHTKNLFSKEYEIDDLLRGYSYIPRHS